MKRIVMWMLSTITVLVLLFGYHTSTSGALASGSGVVAPSTPLPGSGGETTSPSASSSASPSGSSTQDTKTVTGPVAQTRWGPVQVQLTVSAGKITAVNVVQYPDNNPRDEEINSYALPILVQDTLKAQSDKIDMISGATVTSEGYLQSLQGALDQAGR
ncbi:FMN-binding protein [Amycolatopsis sp. K13G38]|uniref:FMN-binding protein n=1 Tax=Amycolatopsis acididurans TaxID=2724524 RepID=A0ABX1JAI6_9PSEU|nr:FMN-binding protein [Amycolatopsis acididurans]NKQ56708.1 FMN-binding protein [Amycolatopsis acididurans]